MLLYVPATFNRPITGSRSAEALLTEVLFRPQSGFDAEREQMWVIGLNAFNHPIYVELVAQGCMDGVSVVARELFRTAIRVGAWAVVLTHNHPNGELVASGGDIYSARRETDAGEILGVPVNDHLVFVTRTARAKSVASTASSRIVCRSYAHRL